MTAIANAGKSMVPRRRWREEISTNHHLVESVRSALKSSVALSAAFALLGNLPSRKSSTCGERESFHELGATMGPQFLIYFRPNLDPN